MRAIVVARTQAGDRAYVTSGYTDVVQTDQPPVQSNKPPTIRFLGLTRVGARMYARFRICDDGTGKVTIVERGHQGARRRVHAQVRGAHQRRLRRVLACWVPAKRFPHERALRRAAPGDRRHAAHQQAGDALALPPLGGAGPARTARPRRATLSPSGRVAQRESARFTRGRSLVRSQSRPFSSTENLTGVGPHARPPTAPCPTNSAAAAATDLIGNPVSGSDPLRRIRCYRCHAVAPSTADTRLRRGLRRAGRCIIADGRQRAECPE